MRTPCCPLQVQHVALHGVMVCMSHEGSSGVCHKQSSLCFDCRTLMWPSARTAQRHSVNPACHRVHCSVIAGLAHSHGVSVCLPTRSLTDPPDANETVMASAGLTSIGGNEVEAGALITLAPKTLYFGAGNYSVPQQLNISRGAALLVHARVWSRYDAFRVTTWSFTQSHGARSHSRPQHPMTVC